MKGSRKIVIIAGPNGAGKTTFAREFLPREADCPEFINKVAIMYPRRSSADGSMPGCGTSKACTSNLWIAGSCTTTQARRRG